MITIQQVDTLSLHLGNQASTMLTNALLSSLCATKAPAVQTPANEPLPGLEWPTGGGIYAGIMRGQGGAAPWRVIKATGELANLQDKWGVDVAVANSRFDGLANTEALAAAGHALAKRLFEAGLYIASLAEAQLCAANIPDQFGKGYHWTSTRDSASLAWVQGFEDGHSYIGSTDLERPFVVLRRLPL